MIHDLTPTAAPLALGILRLLRPYRLLGANKVRVGRFFDGGYVMIDRFEGVEAAYSLGINDDVSWDLDIANRGIKIVQYDHTIDALPAPHPLFNWRRTGIAHVADPAANLDNLETLIKSDGMSGATNMLLKCDIEGAEWPTLAGLPNQVLRQFSQIVIELHRLGDFHIRPNAEFARRALLNLVASHHVVHVHANNFATWAVVGGIPVPQVIELTLMRKDMGVFEPSDEIFPTPLDMPCYSEAADLYLGQFAYS